MNTPGLGSTLRKLGREAARLVLVSPCVVCGAELPWRGRVASCCRPCWSDLPRITEAKCARCGLPWAGGDPSEPFTCIECATHDSPVDWVDAWGHYRGALERVLHAFKFEQHEFLAPHLAGLLAGTLAQRGRLEFDLVIPVPMHPRKRRRRGYNQAELLGRQVARMTGLRFDGSLLARHLEGVPQSTLPRSERRRNVRRAFRASARVQDLSILIVDDICTTGETLRACASALKTAGAGRICAAAVARA